MTAVRTARVLLGVTAKQLADVAGVSTRELRRIEGGEVRAAPATMARLDAAFTKLLHEREAEVRRGG